MNSIYVNIYQAPATCQALFQALGVLSKWGRMPAFVGSLRSDGMPDSVSLEVGLQAQADQALARHTAPHRLQENFPRLPACRSLPHRTPPWRLPDLCSASLLQPGFTLVHQPSGRCGVPRCFQAWGLGPPLTRAWLRAAELVSAVGSVGGAALVVTFSLGPACAQVKSVNLSDGELLSIRGVEGPTLTVLANQSLLVEGQVIRSPTNTVSVYFRTFQDDFLGTFQLHYQGKLTARLTGYNRLPQFPSRAKNSQTFCARDPSGSSVKPLGPLSE